MSQERSLDISWETILKISLLIISFYILYQIKDILVWFVFALIISILFNPPIDFLRKLKVPRVLAVAFVYIGIFGIFILLAYFTVPMFVSEIKQFSQVFPQYFEKISPLLRGIGIKAFENIESFVSLLGGTMEKIAANILNILVLIFGGIFSTIFILAIAIFLSLEEKGIERTLILFFPKEYEDYIFSLSKRCQKKISNWFLVRVITCFFVGVAIYLALLIFKVPYSFSLGLTAGLLNFIPVIGPILTAIIFFVIISVGSLSKAVFVLIVFTLIQQIEGAILAPALSKKIIGLSPVLVLLSLAIGGALWGFLGAVLAVPLAGILSEFLKDYLKKKREEEAVVL